MAITKLLRIKETRGASKSSHLKNNIFYICNPEKTSGGCWIGGNAGTTPEIIYKTMIMNKNYWGKENGTQAFHYVLSFPPDLNIDEAATYKITEEFCKELLGDSFYYCIAVHNDKDHMHAHVTFDSVSKLDGYKFHSPKGDWEKRIQPITDRICEKYEIPTLSYEKEDAKGMDYGSWEDGKRKKERTKTENNNGRNSKQKKEKHTRRQSRKEESKNQDGFSKSDDQENNTYKSSEDPSHQYRNEEADSMKFSWYDIIRDDIDEAVESSDSYEEFLEYLKSLHYETRDRKYLSLKPFGKERFVRSMRLGEEYSKDSIKQRIAGKKKGMEFRRYGNYEKLKEIIREYYQKNGFPTSYQKKFYYRFVCTVNVRHPVFYENWKYKKDVLDLYRYNMQLNYMFRNNIRSKEDAEKKKQDLKDSLRKILSEKRKLQKTIGPESNYYRMRKLMSLQEEIKKYPEGSRDDLLEQARELIGKITLSETLDEALERYNSINTLLDNFEIARKKRVDELKIVDGIVGTSIPDYDYRKYKQDRDNHQDDDSSGRRVTINKKLFADNILKEGFRVFRIPGAKEYVAVPIKNTLRLTEITMSAYIYTEKEYEILNLSGDVMRKTTGKDLMKHFDDRTQKQKKNKSFK